MGRIVKGSDFSDKLLKEFVGSIERLDYTVRGRVPQDVIDLADRFAKPNPRPSPSELRDCVDHAVNEAMGWDDPDQPDKMLHSGLKIFYLLSWLDFLAKQQKGGLEAPLSQALQVAYTPVFKIPEP
jgi:hypothetical protein